MKTKSKLATDIKSLVLEKARVYATSSRHQTRKDEEDVNSEYSQKTDATSSRHGTRKDGEDVNSEHSQKTDATSSRHRTRKDREDVNSEHSKKTDATSSRHRTRKDGEDVNSEHSKKIAEIEKEKKRERMRLKRQQKKEAKLKSVKKDIVDAQKVATEYLRLWNSNRESWSFKKKQQCWLLQNVFKIDCISDEDFEILLNYLEDLKGASKSRLVEESEKIIKTLEEKGQDATSGSDSVIFERARNVIQILV